MKKIKKYKIHFRATFLSICSSFLFCGLFILVNPQKGFGYDNDTHFWLTYYLAIKTGYTRIQAAQIASLNISVDLDKDSSPVLPEINRISELIHPLTHQQEIRKKLHALPRRKEVYNIAKKDLHYWWCPYEVTDPEIQRIAKYLMEKRRDEFWDETIKDGENPSVFLHYLQDSFAHKGFLSYVGHAGYSYVDFLDTDCSKANDMTDDTLKYLVAFRKNLNPNDVKIEFHLTQSDLTEIKRTVRKFCEVNPNPNEGKQIAASGLITAWEKLDGDDKRNRHRRLPGTFYFALLETGILNPSPDSRKSREVVKNVLNYQESDLPDVWEYNLNKKGKAVNSVTFKFLYYGEPQPEKQCFFSKDEKANFKIKDNSKEKSKKIPCMYFKLAKDDENGKYSICTLTD